jgi:hypothetical protein
VFPVGIGLKDPRSQKRDLGHPSISPFDFAEGHALSFLSRLAAASRLLGMTKERLAVTWTAICSTERRGRRDDKGKGAPLRKNSRGYDKLLGSIRFARGASDL